MQGRWWLRVPGGALLVLVALVTACTTGGPGPEDPAGEGAAALNPGEALRDAARLYQERKPEEALAICQTLLKQPLRPLHEAWARYYAGEALFQLQRFYEAHEHFEILIAYFPGFSELKRVIDREYAIACAFVDGRQERPFLWTTISARGLGYEMLEVLLTRFENPGFDYGRFLMGEYQLDEGNYIKAYENYQQLIREYPDSEWADLAQFRAAQATYRTCEGFEYDVEAALAAEEQLADYLRRYPTGNKVAEAEALLAEIRAGLADRNMKIAEYYRDRADQPHSAAIYYATVLRLYPATEEAREAAEELRELVARHPGDPEVAREAERALPTSGD